MHCLSIYVIWHLASPTSISAPCLLLGERMGSLPADKCVQSIPVSATRKDQLAMGDGYTLDADLAASLLLSKTLFQPALHVLRPPWGLRAHRCCSRPTSVGSSFCWLALLCSEPSSMWWESTHGYSRLTHNIMPCSNNHYCVNIK